MNVFWLKVLFKFVFQISFSFFSFKLIQTNILSAVVEEVLFQCQILVFLNLGIFWCGNDSNFGELVLVDRLSSVTLVPQLKNSYSIVYYSTLCIFLYDKCHFSGSIGL